MNEQQLHALSDRTKWYESYDIVSAHLSQKKERYSKLLRADFVTVDQYNAVCVGFSMWNDGVNTWQHHIQTLIDFNKRYYLMIPQHDTLQQYEERDRQTTLFITEFGSLYYEAFELQQKLKQYHDSDPQNKEHEATLLRDVPALLISPNWTFRESPPDSPSASPPLSESPRRQPARQHQACSFTEHSHLFL